MSDRPFHQRLRRGLGETFIAWSVWLFFWQFLRWRGRQPILIMSEQLNQIAFMVLGAISGGITLVWLLLKWRQRRIRLARLNHLEDLRALSPEDFESVVSQLFETNGHQVEQVGGSSDHGVDIVVTNEQGEKWIVQCKRYSGSVGEPVVRDLYGTMLHEEAQGAYLMTTGVFTQKAQAWAEGKPIHLYDGDALIQLIQMTRSKR
jgi:restriction system protein